MKSKIVIVKAAEAVSTIFSPMLAPTYGLTILLMLLFVRYHIPPQTISINVAVVFLLTALAPYLYLRTMVAMRLASDLDLSKRTERTRHFLLILLLYAATVFYLYKINLPLWMVAFMIGAIVALVVAIVVNRWWKISAHASGMGGLTAVAMTTSVMFPVGGMTLLCLTVLASGLVMTARVILGCHTPGQVYAGWFNGLLCVYLAMLLIS